VWSLREPFASPQPRAAILGTGRLTLDAIVSDESAEARSQAGGTCGNVLANLAYLGWTAYPLTQLGDDDPGDRFCRDMARWGATLDLIERVPSMTSPVIVHHIRHDAAGRATHSFSSTCPFCNNPLAGYSPVPLAGVERVLPRLPVVNVFFTDRDSEGSLLLARTVAGRGGLVVFEPNYDGDAELFPAMLSVCHILKFARARLPGLDERWPLTEPMVVIETLGQDGLRYRDQRQGSRWEHIPALPMPVERDAGGCGDWTTAGLMHGIGQAGQDGLRVASPEQLNEALRFGQALAAWNVAFEGARGGVYRVDGESMRRSVLDLLADRIHDPLKRTTHADSEPAGRFCPRCGGRPPIAG
jgi:sugar/nucleoside kinase (ribokinase family)